MEKLVPIIIQGLKDVFHYYDNAGIDRQGKIKPEYLLTSFIGKRIAEYNFNSQLNFIIHLEEPTSKFIKGCIPYFPLQVKNTIDEIIQIRKGKIDIAIVKEERNHYPYKAIGAVEIKNVNPKADLFFSDIKRIIGLMQIAPASGIKNEDAFGIFACIEERREKSKQDEDKIRRKIFKTYSKRLNKTKFFNGQYSYNLTVEMIDNDLVTTPVIVSEDEGDNPYDVIQGTFIRFGVVVTIRNIS